MKNIKMIFIDWWLKNGGTCPTSDEIFEAGWRIGFNHADNVANLREKLIMEELKRRFVDLNVDELIVKATVKA